MFENDWKFESAELDIFRMSCEEYDRFAQALAELNFDACRSYFQESFADDLEELDDIRFIWPILITRPAKELVESIRKILEVCEKPAVEFILANIPPHLTDRQLARLFRRELPNSFISKLVSSRPLIFDHIENWQIQGIPEKVAQRIIDAGFGTKVSPDGHILSFAFIKTNAKAMDLEGYVATASNRDGHDGPASLFAISLCEVMPPVEEMVEFTKEYRRVCYRDVPQDYVDEMPRAVQRIRDFYKRIDTNITIPEMQLIARRS